MSLIPPAKRTRTETDDNTNTTDAAAVINSTNNKDTNNNSSLENDDVISTSKILQQITTLSNDYRIAKPFPHGVISNFCTDGLLGELYVVYVDIIKTSIEYRPSNLQSIYYHHEHSLFLHTINTSYYITLQQRRY